MKPERLPLLTRSFRETFKTQLFTDITDGPPVEKKNSTVTDDFTAMIGFTGDLKGALILSMPRNAARALVKRMCGGEIELRDEEIGDGIGEICNIVAGLLKSGLRAEGVATAITTPSILTGAGTHLVLSDIEPVFTIPWSCDLGTFVTEAGLLENGAAAGA